jgi:uncharacterized repeat protein (TIGR01451 family)
MNAPLSRRLQATLCLLLLPLSVEAANPPPTQLFYIPFAENDQLAAFKSVSGVANDPIAVFVTFSAATDGTVIYYDHWEDGYEADITNPVQPTTLVFGDGNPSNGFPPGNPGDLIPAGTVFNLRNFVTTSSLQSVVDFDARDKVATFKPISLTKTTFPTGTNTLLAGCVEVFEYGLWGTDYRSPVGVNMPTSAAAGNLTFDENLFSHNSLSIMAGPGGASVQIDKDNNGAFEETVALAEGQTIYRDGVNVGGRILSDKPVQVILFNGTVGSTYASRDTSMLPVFRWSSDYFCPVSTRISPTDGTVTFLYNPGTSAITVNYDYRDSASSYVTNSVSVPAGGNARVVMQPAGTGHFGAYRFYTTGSEPPVFYAFSAIDADSTSGNNVGWDGGFTLVGRPSLTTQVLVSLGIGRDPYSATNPNENGNPIWVTSVGNGNTQERIYVDYNGDNAGALTDPNGNKYDVHFDVRELEQLKLFDPDGDQSGMLVYSLNPNVRLAAVWGQDPSVAAFAQPGLDVASLIPPLREGDAGKKSTVKIDADGDGYTSAGDTLEIEIRAVSNARATIPGPFNFQDNLPADLAYVPGSTRFRYSVGGNWQAWTPIPDDGSGTPFPLDGAGFPVPGNLLPGQQIQVVFDAAVAGYGDLTSGTIQNTGLVEISPYGLRLPIQWTDTIYGSISDTVWNDLNGDGIQDPGENGLPGVRVWADLNSNGIQDPGEPADVTDPNGNYLLGGLVAGTYTVRVNPADIAAINVGYGPSYDLDGVATSHAATVVLAAAEMRQDADFGYRVGASVGDRVWLDRNGDRAQGAGEPGINGVRVYIDSNGSGSYDSGEPNTITSGDGTYYIGNLNPGTYTVRVDTSTLPTGATQTHDLNGALDHAASVTLIAAEHRSDLDFGYRGTLSIGDLVWEDVDANGTRVTYNVIDGRIDINNSGTVSNADDGFIGGVQIIDGFVDINGSGAISNADDGVFQGITVINGGLDVNNSGGVSNADDLTAAINAEFGIAGVRVYIDSNGNGTFDTHEATAVTNADGLYSINNLFNGTYTVRVDTSTLPSSYVPTYDLVSPVGDHTAVVVLSGSSRTDVDFGYRNDASLGDLVWNDRNNNGIRDAGEPGIAGVLVYIDANSDGIYDPATERSAITDLNGFYLVDNLPAGTYLARVEISTLPQGSTQTYDLDGLGTPHRASRTLAISQDATDVDFGYRANASFGDFVWNDLDGDGVQDPGEPGIPGVRVYADMNGNGIFDSATEPSATTDSNGAYSIGNLVPGTYTARVDTGSLPPGLIQTFDAVGSLDNAATFFISANQARADIDFGYTAPVTIGDFVWNDIDADGQQDNGEPGLSGVTITLFNAANDTIVATTTSGSGGSYSFTAMPGAYYVVFGKPVGFEPTPANQGADISDSDAGVTDGKSQTVTLTGGQADSTIDAGFYQPGTVSGHLYIDTNGNGSQDSGEPDLAGVDVIVIDSLGNPQTVTSDSSGNWSASVPPGVTSADVDETDPDYPTGSIQTEGDDPTTVIAVSGNNTDAGIDGYAPPVDLAIVKSVDNPTPLVGSQVVFTLTASNNGPGNATGVTVSDVLPGGYTFVSANPPAAYDNGTGVWTIGGLANGASDTLTISATVNASGAYLNVATIGGDQPDPTPENDSDDALTTPIQLGAISGSVREDTDNNGSGDTPIEGVILSLVDGGGSPVLDGGNPVTTSTAPDGSYSFANLPPGTYGVVETQPAGYASLSDKDGGNLDEIRPITVLAGETNTLNDFVEISRCPDTWADWKQLHPAETAAGNPDADQYDNFAEFAFAMPYDDGTGSPWLGSTAWIIKPSDSDPEIIDGVFVRPKGAPLNVVYTLQYAAAPGNPTLWQDVVIDTGLTGNATTVDNGDCTETVTIHDLETLTTLTGGKGVVRIKAELDDDGGNDEVDHTSLTEPEGWTETPLEVCCRTYNNPYLRETAFTGTVSGVSGQTVTFAVSGGAVDLSSLLATGSWFIEVLSGDLEGHRLDVVSATGNTLTVASDPDLNSAAAPYNTLIGAPLGALAGDVVALRRHWTLNEVFPPTGFGATNSQSSADQVQVFSGGSWTIHWLYDNNDADPQTARWVSAADAGMADQGASVIPPGQGVFFNNRNVATSVLAYGEVRANDFIRPLAAGNNLVGGGFPVDQSINGPGGRAMNTVAGFFGGYDFKTADSAFIWQADSVITASGYHTYYLVDGSPAYPALLRWVKVGDAALTARDAETLLPGNRSAFIRAKNPVPSYTSPAPWNP